MKKLLFLLSLCSILIAPCSLQAQSIPPPYINYQAVLYDINGSNPNAVLANQSFPTFVNIQDELGNLLYKEEHYTSTDANGLVTVKMGDGVYMAGPITNFNLINWGVGKYYLVVDFDINGTISSTAPEQLVTVPYAFYAGNSGSGISAISDNGDGSLTFTYNNGTNYTTPVLSGLTGPQGIQGLTGANGVDGKNTLSKTTIEAAGTNCTTGGVKLEYGLDANGNGMLDISEINATMTNYVCNGAVGAAGLTGATGIQGLQGVAGTNGLNALIKTTAEASGANCANGGTKIETGLDANSNGTLDASEVNAIQTRYVCNGNVTSGTQTLSINGVNTTQYVPDYLYNTGNCASGSLSTTGNFTLNSTYAEYCNLKINSGHTFNLPYQGLNGWNSGKGITVTILVKDTLVINGIINGVPTGTHNPFVFGGDLNTAGGPGGSSSKYNGSTTGVNSLIEWDSYNSTNGILPPTYSMTFTGGSGCTTVTPPNNITVSALQEAIKIKSQLGGVAGQGSAEGGYSLTPYNNGGYGGTGLYIICRVLVFNGQINLKGSNGTSSYSSAGVNVYGGGGGGGSLVISAETILQNTGAINLSGGTGISTSSPTYCDSSAGGSGAYIIIDR